MAHGSSPSQKNSRYASYLLSALPSLKEDYLFFPLPFEDLELSSSFLASSAFLLSFWYHFFFFGGCSSCPRMALTSMM